MSTVPTNKPVPSKEMRDLAYNAERIDEFVTSLQHEYKDRFGQCHRTIEGINWVATQLIERFKVEMEQAILVAGYVPVGTFQEGAELANRNETVLWKLPDGDGDHYRWDGDLPKPVPAGSTPQSTGGIGKGAWVSVGDASLRGELLTSNGDDVIYSISKTKYLRVGSFEKGAIITKGNEALKYEGFYYAVKNESVLPITINPNSAPNNDWICVGNATMPIGRHSLFDFGCVDDNGITDNRLNIQRAIEYMEWCKSEMYTDSSADNKYFGINSFHPLYPAKHCLIMRRVRNININGGRTRNSSIRYTGSESGESLVEWVAADQDWGATVKFLGLHAGNKLDYCLKGIDVWYAQCNFEGGCYENAVLDGIQLSTYMSSFTRVFSNNNGRGNFSFGGPLTEGGLTSGTTTSLSLNNCWSRGGKQYGYKVYNELWYSEWNSCGNDGFAESRTKLAYDFDNIKGCVFNGMGAEQTEKFFKARSFRGLTLNGIQLSDVGSATTGIKLDYCIELGGGFDAVISGFSPVTAFSDKFDYDLFVSNATGNESVTILDHSIRSNRVGFNKATPNGYYRYPDIFSWASGRSQDSGFARTGNTLYPSANYQTTAQFTGIQDTIIKRDFIVRITGKQTVPIFSTPSSTNFTIVIDITEITKSGTKSAVARQWVSSKVNGSISLHGSMGEPQSGWSFDNPSGGGVIGVIDSTPDVDREFMVSIRFTSTDGSGISFNF